LLPSIRSLAKYSPSSFSRGSPSAATYNCLLVAGSGAMTLTLAMNCTSTAPSVAPLPRL
jgi:hypothetical protein